MKSVVVTGVSTGIGWGATKVLTKAGFHVFGSVRKEADAQRLKQEFGERFTPLLFDVTDVAAVKRGADEVRAALKGKTLFGLVNNAGIAVSGPLLELPLDEFRQQMEVNVTGPLIVTQAFAPLLGADTSLKGAPGRIVNISSVGGKQAAPFVGPYSASKYALEGLSESLRRELLLFGIDVIIIGPGAVKTQIWAKAEEVDITPYLNSPYYPSLVKFRTFFLKSAKTGLTPERLGRAILKALTVKNPKVRYAVVRQRLQNWTIPQLLPKRFVDRLIGRNVGLLKP
ncbi:SDR family NAD(P)-dependent oxidoreductase [Parvibaculum sedimenti]|uniref:SDR family NAD(P)-dependent oxidoreductase n=1 Tax=Parvibaculum sedimenti TaxID=2608632 RepID=A0A6N6VSC5_9HYPH|nr:SDR family oxidoreductase [Parvibaculum sedimenti]KAB7742874.1 SDR family NAD(P)-dependent oxidoreductase [Parvibaculum sedimenti]